MKVPTQLDEAASWIAELQSDDIPPDVRALARSQVIDTIGAICAGARSDTGQRAYLP